MTDIQQLCAEWQARLGLRDWTVTVEPAHAYALGRKERSAEIQMELGTRHARLSVLRADAVPDDMIAPHDEETSLVHELLHIHLQPVLEFDGEAQHWAAEQMLNAVADALVALRRAGGQCG